MAVRNFSALTNGQAIAFDPNSDVLNFDQAAIAAASLDLLIEGANLRITVMSGTDAGKSIVLQNVLLEQLASSNVTFANGSQLLFGDNATTRADAGSTALIGSGGADLLSGFGGHDTLAGGAGDDRFVVNFDNGVDGAMLTGTAAAVDGDVNGDGHADLLWRSQTTGQDYLYTMNGTAITSGEGSLRTVADLNWSVVGTGDFDGDGKADLLWRNHVTGENYLYLMDGRTIKATEGYIRTVSDPNWQIAALGDFNGDHRDDILWRNQATGENYVYLMNGTAIAGEGYLRTVADLNWHIAGSGDFNGDGRADILWRNAVTGENYIYLMNGTAISGEGYLRTVADQSWQIAGTGDLDGDGHSDIVWRNASTGENYVYFMDGTSIVQEGYLRTVADQHWQIEAIGDYDGDGNSDLFWRNSATGENYLYPMDGLVIKASEGYVRSVPENLNFWTWHGDTFRPDVPAEWTIPGNASYGDDSINGGAGFDTVDFAHAKSAIMADLGDITQGTAVAGGEGGTGRMVLADVEAVIGSRFADRIAGNGADNRLEGGDGNDTISGLGGNDSLVGDEGADSLSGGEGNDTLDAWVSSSHHGDDNAADTLDGGLGNDVYQVSYGDIILPDPGGIDTVRANDTSWTLGRGLENLSLVDDLGSGYSGTGNELNNTISSSSEGGDLFGEGGDDLLIARHMQNTAQLHGGDGDDTLDGSGWHTRMFGDAGNDLLISAGMDDTMEGGSGADTFLFVGLGGNAGGMFAAVTDFTSGTDKLSFDAKAFTAMGYSGNFSAGDARFFAGTAAHNADDRVIFDAATGNVWYDADGNGAGMPIMVANVTGDVVATDIAVINGSVPPTLINGTEGNDSLRGTSGSDIIYGLGGSDILDGNGGNDFIDGGDGGDRIIAGIGNDTLLGGTGNDYIRSGSGSNLIDGGGGDDTLLGGDGLDTLIGGAGNDLLKSNLGADSLSGGDGNDTLDAQSYVNDESGHFILEAGQDGVDTLDGGLGDDTYYYVRGYDIVTDPGGIDTIITDVSWTLGEDGENLTLLGDAPMSGTGNAGANVITGGEGADTLTGLGGDDSLIGGAGDDSLVGGDGADTLIGGDGNDTLDGYYGGEVVGRDFAKNTLDGGFGDDTYIVAGDTAHGDTIITDPGGYDTVITLRTDFWVMGPGLDALSFSGDVGGRGIGNELDNVIDSGLGTGGDLWGMGGNDRLRSHGYDAGGAMHGGEGNDTLEGGFRPDVLIGGAGNDVLNGGGGTWGRGDSYVFDAAPGVVNADTIIGFSSGLDQVRLDRSVMSTLGAAGQFTADDGRFFASAGATGGHDAGERVVYDTSTGNLYYDADGSGAAAGQLIATLQGAPKLTAADMVVIDGGTGQAISGTSGNDALVGTSGPDVINGSGGNDTIDGAAGPDTMIGGTGDDVYFVDNNADLIVEAANEGIDEVRSSVGYTLPDWVNNLTLTGSAISGTGNAIENVLTGNSLGNILSGGDANDTLIGAGGNDTLMGGTGDDTFLFNVAPGAANADRVTDFASGIDMLQLDQSVFSAIAGGHFAGGDSRFYAGSGATGGHDGDDRVVYNTSNGDLYYDADGSGAGAAQLIATLAGAPSLAASDIWVT